MGRVGWFILVFANLLSLSHWRGGSVPLPSRLFSAWVISSMTSPVQGLIFLHWRKVPDTLLSFSHFLKQFPGSQACPHPVAFLNKKFGHNGPFWRLGVRLYRNGQNVLASTRAIGVPRDIEWDTASSSFWRGQKHSALKIRGVKSL